jgi:peptidoglycan/LPS O-acetylase OafA/YrhL
LILISIIYLFIVNEVFGGNSDGSYRVIEFGIPAIIFFIGMLSLEDFFRDKHENIFLKVTKAIGDSSYSLYLFHTFSLVIFSIIFKKLGLTDFGYLFVFLLVITSIISGHLCYLFLEKKLDNLLFMKNK